MSVKTKNVQEAKRPAKYWSLDEFNRVVKKVSDAISIMINEPEFFIEVEGQTYYIPANARLVVKSAATVQYVFN